jgi:uncharacterized protein DUF2784
MCDSAPRNSGRRGDYSAVAAATLRSYDPPSVMNASQLADIVAIIHVVFVAFVVGGFAFIVAGQIRQIPVTQSQTFRRVHLLAVGAELLRTLLGWPCPLTTLEEHLREIAPSRPSPIANWAHRLFFRGADHHQFLVALSIFAGIVVINAAIVPPAIRGRESNRSRR